MHVIIHLSKPKEWTTPKVNPNVNYGLWVLIMCHCRFISCNNGTTLVGDIVWGQGIHGKSLTSAQC